MRIIWLVLGICSLSAEQAAAQAKDRVEITDTTWQPVVRAPDTLREPRNWDERLLFDINAIGKHDHPTLDLTMIVFTQSIYPLSIAMPAGFYAGGWASDNREMAIAGIDMALSEMLSGLTTITIKTIVQRPRPYATLLDIRLPTGEERGYSFPSGHSTAAWAMTTSLMLSYPRWYVIAPAAIYSTMVSISRPYVGVHYPTDILVGAIIGAGSAFIIDALEPSIVKTFPGIFPKQKSGGTSILLRVPVIHIIF